MAHTWQLVNASANVPAADGVAHCRHENGNLFLEGGIYTGTLKGLYRAHESSPGNWTKLYDLPIANGSHTHFLVPHSDGRIYRVGGDLITGSYQPTLYSFDETGNDFQTEDLNCPSLNRGLFFAFSKGNYIYVGGGQKMPPGFGSVVFCLDLWRWSRAGGWELVNANMPWGTKGLISTIAQAGNKHYLIGSGSYEYSPWGRQHKHDIYSIDENLEVECVNGRVNFLDRIWHNTLYWDNSLWCMLGANSNLGGGSLADLNDVKRSDDLGVTWVDGPTFPGTKRHAAAAFATPGGIVVTTGSHYGLDVYRLIKDAFNYGAPFNSYTGWDSGYSSFTAIDRFITLPAGKTVKSIGVMLTHAKSNVRVKILKENAPNNYDVISSQAPQSHPGGNIYQDYDLGAPFTVPSTGTYRIGFSAYLPTSPADAFSSQGTRASYAGDAAGNGVTCTYSTDGTVVMRWAEP